MVGVAQRESRDVTLRYRSIDKPNKPLAPMVPVLLRAERLLAYHGLDDTDCGYLYPINNTVCACQTGHHTNMPLAELSDRTGDSEFPFSSLACGAAQDKVHRYSQTDGERVPKTGRLFPEDSATP